VKLCIKKIPISASILVFIIHRPFYLKKQVAMATYSNPKTRNQYRHLSLTCFHQNLLKDFAVDKDTCKLISNCIPLGRSHLHSRSFNLLALRTLYAKYQCILSNGSCEDVLIVVESPIPTNTFYEVWLNWSQWC